jgi:uncharacterized protein (TIGR02118 family)
MIKCFYGFKRKPNMTVEEFKHYWRVIHVPIALEIPGIKKYILCYPLPSEYLNKEPVYDGVAELWFNSEEDLKFAMQTEAWQISGKDGENFMEKSSFISLISTEDVII